ncbi:MAG UNVERIFIED_CONTAM: hypothetical protein LVR18_30180 [Planctomycetaceae bacterium]|jgi:hypothetical protein
MLRRSNSPLEYATAHGKHAILEHPFLSRGLAGFNELAATLEQRGHQVRFVCGHVSSSPRSLVLRPVSIIIDDTQRRFVTQPWVPSCQGTSAEAPKPSLELVADNGAVSRISPVEQFLEELGRGLSELVLLGIIECASRDWTALHRQACQLGFVRLNQPLAELVNQLECRSSSLRWNAGDAIQYAHQLFLIYRVAHG